LRPCEQVGPGALQVSVSTTGKRSGCLALLEVVHPANIFAQHLAIEKERSALINRRRFADVKFMFGDMVNSDEVVFAVGQRVPGQGRMEFYLGSQLMHVTLFARNKGLCPLCCKRRFLSGRNRTNRV